MQEKKTKPGPEVPGFDPELDPGLADAILGATCQVFYHGQGCVDGAYSLAVWRALLPSAHHHTFVPYDHTRKDLELGLYEEKTVLKVFLDCSPSDKELAACLESSSMVLVVDHHASEIERLRHRRTQPGTETAGRLHLYQDVNACGALLTWQLLRGDAPPPWILQKVDVRDRHAPGWGDGDAPFLHAAVALSENPLEAASAALHADMAAEDGDYFELMAKRGAELHGVRLRMAKEVAAQAFAGWVENKKAVVVNCPPQLMQQACEVLLDSCPSARVAAAWHSPDGKNAKVSLRSRFAETGKDDLTGVLRRRGGGGHPGAGSYTGVLTEVLESFELRKDGYTVSRFEDKSATFCCGPEANFELQLKAGAEISGLGRCLSVEMWNNGSVTRAIIPEGMAEEVGQMISHYGQTGELPEAPAGDS